jgi:hypothetical protein
MNAVRVRRAAALAVIPVALLCAGANTPVAPLGPSLPMRAPGPMLGAFPAIRATAVGPTAIEVDWMPLAGADLYRVYRNGIQLTGSDIKSVPTATTQLTFLDSSAPNNTSLTYSVTALHTTTINGLPNTPNAGKSTTSETLLQTSNPVAVVAPPLLPPQGLTASIDAANPALVHLSWPAAPNWQAGFIVSRNGANIGAPSSLGMTDTLPGPGWYTYQVTSALAQPNGTTAVSTPSAGARLHSGPMRVLAFGDSIMWGQGLADPDKFTTLIRAWLMSNVAMPVFMTNLAHSGAVVQIGPSPVLPAQVVTTIEQSEALKGGIPNQFGEAPNSFPTISFQGLTMGTAQGSPDLVDLIVVDGCINDVGVATVLDPRVKDNDLHNSIQTACGVPELTMLSGLHGRYPNAKIVVTGYFKIASDQSDLSLLNGLATGVGINASVIASAVGGPAAAAFGLPPPDPISAAIIGAIVGNVAADTYRKIAVDHSTILVNDSSMLLQQNVNSINQLGAGTVAAFASVPFTDANSYAAPQSWLWLVPTPATAQDEVFAQRGTLCQHLPAGDTNYNGATCPIASMGHPNVTGAQQYALAVERQLQQWVPGWRKAFATTQSVP